MTMNPDPVSDDPRLKPTPPAVWQSRSVSAMHPRKRYGRYRGPLGQARRTMELMKRPVYPRISLRDATSKQGAAWWALSRMPISIPQPGINSQCKRSVKL
jgi:hypothetical protein